MEGNEGDWAMLFSAVISNKMGGSAHKLKHLKFWDCKQKTRHFTRESCWWTLAPFAYRGCIIFWTQSWTIPSRWLLEQGDQTKCYQEVLSSVSAFEFGYLFAPSLHVFVHIHKIIYLLTLSVLNNPLFSASLVWVKFCSFSHFWGPLVNMHLYQNWTQYSRYILLVMSRGKELLSAICCSAFPDPVQEAAGLLCDKGTPVA